MINIYCSPLGISLRDKFIEQIKTSNLPYGQELLLLPSNFLMQEVRQTAAIKVSSFDALVFSLLGCFNANKIPTINRFAQELLLTAIIDELVRTDRLKYFTPICQTKSFCLNILSLIGDFMRAGITSTELEELLHFTNPDEEQHSAKSRDLLLIFRIYHEQLQNHQVLDLELSYQLVLRLLQMYKLQEDATLVLPWKKIYISDFYHFSTLQLEIIKLLEYFCPLEINLVYEKSTTNLFSPTQYSLEFLQGLPQSNLYFSPSTLERTPELNFICENLVRNNLDKIPVQEVNAIKINIYKTPEQEMRSVLANIKEKILAGANYRDFLIIVRNVKNYTLLRELAGDAGISISLGKNIAVRQTSLYRLLLNFLQIKSFTADKEKIAGFYTSPIFKQLHSLPIELLEKFFYENNIFSYHDIKSLPSLDQFTSSQQEFLQELLKRLDSISLQANPNEYIILLQEMLLFLNPDTILGAAYQNNELSLEYLKTTLLALEVLENSLLELSNTYELLKRTHQKMTLQDFINDFADQIKNKELTIQAGNPYGIRVVSASDVQGVTAPFVYVLGLTSGEFPQFEKENWLLSESEKFSLGLPNLPTLSLAIAEDNYFFATACATATQLLFLSSVPSERAGVSNYLTQISQLLITEKNQPLLVMESSVADLPPLENIFDRKTLLKYCAGKLALEPENTFCKKILTDNLGTDYLEKYALDQQRSLGENIYHGHLLAPDLLSATQKLVGKKFSASTLEIYAACPFKYLAEKIWQVHSWEDIDDFGDNRVVGTLYHNVLARFLKKYISQNLGKFVTIELVAELKEIWQQELQQLLLETHASAEKILLLRGEETWLRLEKWLYKEIYWQKNALQNILPLVLEQEFAFKINDIIIGGRIDRIDGNGNYFIVLDYKSGNHPNKKDLLEGRDLQIPLYLLGTTELLLQKKLLTATENCSVIGGTYFSLKKGVHADGWWAEIAKDQVPYAQRAVKELLSLDDLRSQTETFISNYVKNIYQGVFPPQENSRCRYCYLKNICRKSSEIFENGDDD